MEDILNILTNVRQPQYVEERKATQYFRKRKTTSIFRLVEDDINDLKLKRWLSYPQLVLSLAQLSPSLFL
jgi:hypothetical protein